MRKIQLSVAALLSIMFLSGCVQDTQNIAKDNTQKDPYSSISKESYFVQDENIKRALVILYKKSDATEKSINEMQTNLSSLTLQIQNLSNTLNSLKQSSDLQNGKINSLESSANSLKQEIQTLPSSVEKLMSAKAKVIVKSAPLFDMACRTSKEVGRVSRSNTIDITAETCDFYKIKNGSFIAKRDVKIETSESESKHVNKFKQFETLESYEVIKDTMLYKKANMESPAKVYAKQGDVFLIDGEEDKYYRISSKNMYILKSSVIKNHKKGMENPSEVKSQLNQNITVKQAPQPQPVVQITAIEVGKTVFQANNALEKDTLKIECTKELIRKGLNVQDAKTIEDCIVSYKAQKMTPKN